MKPTTFIQKIKALVGYDETKEVLELVEMTNNASLSMVESFNEAVKDSPELRESEAYKTVNDLFTKVGLGDLSECLRRVVERNGPIFEKVKQEYFSGKETIAADSIPLPKANAMLVMSTIGFIAQQARFVIITILSNQSATALKGKSGLSKAFQKETLDVDGLIKAIVIFERNGDNVVKLLKSIPNIDLEKGDFNTLAGVHGAAKTDPLRMGFVPLSWNPFHYLGMKWAAYKVAKYKAMQEDVKLFEYQVMLLKERRDGTSNPKLEKVLEIYEEKVNILHSKIKRMEE